MQDSDRLSPSVLLHLDNDEWVKSVWTYQEVVNSKLLYFVSDSAVVDGCHFLNCLGHSLEIFKTDNHLSDFDVAERLPKLHALEEVVVDWMTGDYAERSALRAMSQFKHRYNADLKNYFYAVVGTIVKGPWPWKLELSVEDLAEEFMEVCERKNDFSFIYSSNPRCRDDPKGRRWRPLPGLLQSIIVWNGFRNCQKGHYDDEGGFWLEKMITLEPSGEMGDEGRSFLLQWLNRGRLEVFAGDDDDIAKRMLKDLRQMVFTGSDQHILTEYGIFYSQEIIAGSACEKILLAADVGWVFGASGLAVVIGGDGREYVPGVFVGEVLGRETGDVLLN